MSTCSGKQDLRGEEYHWDGALARLVRRALHESVGKEEPSPRVWREIAEGISSQSQTRGRRVSGGLRPLRSAALAQVVVIVALLLAFGFSLDRSYPLPQMRYGATPTIGLPERVSSPGSTLDDMLSGLRLARSARELTVRDYRLAPFAELPH